MSRFTSRAMDASSRFSRGLPSALISVATGLIAAVVALLRATVPTFAGQGPHPDGDRYLCQLGTDAVEPVLKDAPRYWDFALFEWQHTGSPPASPCIPYPSSQIWVLRALEWFSSAISGRPGTLDFHWLVIANALLIGLIVGLFASAANRASLAVRLLGSALMLLILSDPVFASYAAGPMGEYVGLVGVALVGVGTVYYSTFGRQWWGVLLVGAGGWLVVTSKVQMITLLVPLAAMLLWIPISSRRGRRRRRSVTGAFTGRIIGAALVVVFVASAGWMLSNNPKEFQQINPWELISVGILGPSHTPAQDLEEMGFPAEMAKYAGKTAGDEGSVMHTPEWREYGDRMNYGTVARFLLAHPDRVWPLLNTGAYDFFVAQPTYMGANEPGHGPKKQPAFSLIAAVGKAINGLHFFVVGGALAFTLGALARRRSQRGSPAWGFANAAVLMAAFTVVQFITAVFGEAIENTKHLVFAILSSTLVVPFIAVSLLQPTGKLDGDGASGEDAPADGAVASEEGRAADTEP
ncbi:glycan biosynthesis hexose transferase WsfD [Leifsonia sp. 21MFCrub1.1]|uniref:glycan biosynthesis hexose transferase WsfD n=1 Tax=Leifsonia sp. 21MFCrub1.1 TaxID=1798223 RepID=UPI0015614F3D|nr:hypothetical protein [Leifsonia sp. 21MFCrub1.1]